MGEPSEHLEILAAKQDPQRFAPLYERYHRAILLFLLKRVHDRDLAADLTSQVFLKAMLALPRYDQRGAPFKAWLYRIALNEALMFFRKHKGRVFMDIDRAEARQLGQDLEQVEPGTEAANDKALEEALGKLRPDQALLVELHWFDRLSYSEVGQVLGLGEDAVKMRTHRVLRLLRQYLSSGR